MNRVILVISFAAAALFVAAPAIAQQNTTGGNATIGKRIFLADGCYECHGTEGAGGGYTGPRLAPDPLPLAAIKSQLRKPASRMPAYSERVISDAQIADIAAYLRSIPAAKPASQIPILNQP
jgi:mono/diheme cytochrome c family protein